MVRKLAFWKGWCLTSLSIDIVFPILPRWFTSALRARPLRERTYSHNSEPRSSIELSIPPHDHSLLESLHSAVYSNRFINTKPLCVFWLASVLFQLIFVVPAILPSYLTTYFRNVSLGHTTSFSMPPVAPLRPLPEQPTLPPIVPMMQEAAEYNMPTTYP